MLTDIDANIVIVCTEFRGETRYASKIYCYVSHCAVIITHKEGTGGKLNVARKRHLHAASANPACPPAIPGVSQFSSLYPAEKVSPPEREMYRSAHSQYNCRAKGKDLRETVLERSANHKLFNLLLSWSSPYRVPGFRGWDAPENVGSKIEILFFHLIQLISLYLIIYTSPAFPEDILQMREKNLVDLSFSFETAASNYTSSCMLLHRDIKNFTMVELDLTVSLQIQYDVNADCESTIARRSETTLRGYTRMRLYWLSYCPTGQDDMRKQCRPYDEQKEAEKGTSSIIRNPSEFHAVGVEG